MDETIILTQAGLSEEQALTYQSLLDKGPQKASSLAQWTGIKRGLTYKVLQELENLGLVEKKEPAAGVATFFPLHPNGLLQSIDRKKESLDRTYENLSLSLSSLASKFNLQNSRPGVHFFEGKQGVIKVLDDSLSTKGEILTYLNLDTVITYFAAENDAYVKKREQKKIKKRIIACINRAAIDFIKQKHQHDPEYFTVTDFRFIETPIHDFQAAMQLYDNKVGLITIASENPIGTIIEDDRIAQMQKSMFEALYNQAVSYEKYLSS